MIAGESIDIGEGVLRAWGVRLLDITGADLRYRSELDTHIARALEGRAHRMGRAKAQPLPTTRFYLLFSYASSPTARIFR